MEYFRIRIFVLVVIAFVCIGFSIKAWRNNNKQLKELNKIEGVVSDCKYQYTKGSRGKDHKIIVITIPNSNIYFGIYDKYDFIFNQYKPYDFIDKDIKIYYDSLGDKIENNITLHLYQVELNGKIVLSLYDSRKYDRMLLYITLGLFVLSITGIIYMVIQKRKRIQ